MTRKKSKEQKASERARGRLAKLDEEIRRLPGRGAPNLDPEKLMQSISPRMRRRGGSRTAPSRELIDAAAKALIERVKSLLKKDGDR